MKASVAFVVLLALFAMKLISVSASCKEAAVGIADGFISDLTGSSEHNASTPAKNGRLNYTAGSSWCASTKDRNPHLQVDLHTLYVICAVSTQGDSQRDHWVKNYTLHSSTDGTTWTDYREGGQAKSFSGNYNRNSTVKHILYKGIFTRYLRFVIGVSHNGACLRVEIFGVPRIRGNIALFKSTIQSSTQGASISSKAVDGVKNAKFNKCASTNTSTDPWWRVDLGREQPVAEVRILNRGDCCATRLDGAEIRVGNSAAGGGAAAGLCADNIQVQSGREKAFFCRPEAYGRYVYVRIPGNGKVLTLCEVEVYSTSITNLALNQSADQISTVFSAKASRAVDGINSTNWSDGSCTRTHSIDYPWWKVDLGSSVPVAEVVIFACVSGVCGSGLSSFEIRIGNDTQNGGKTNQRCGETLSLDGGQTKPFYCVPAVTGRYVFVRRQETSTYLSICEVEVYSARRSSNSLKGCASDPVGISDSSIIRDQRFKASSTRSGSNPYSGRLKGSNAWTPSSNNDANDFLQIGLGAVYFVCAVATQGNPNADNWSNTYKIGTSLNNVDWTIYVEDTVEKTFTGNSDRNSVVRTELYKPVAAKFIRFYPVTFTQNKALRVEVYGSLQVQGDVPRKPVVQVNQSGIQARSAVVRWSYSAGSDDIPIVLFALRYHNTTFTEDIVLTGDSFGKQLNNLKPYTLYNVSIKATSVLGAGDWSNAMTFTTLTASPDIVPEVDNVTGATPRTIYIEWTQPSNDKLNGPAVGYTISYREVGACMKRTDSASISATAHTIQNLKIWTRYKVKMRVNNRDYSGPWSPEKQTRTHEDAPSQPQNLQLNINEPNGNTRPRMAVTWSEPATKNGIIKRYTLSYRYNSGRTTIQHTTDGRTFSYSFDVLGGVKYIVEVRAETIKPGPSVTGTKQVPVYRPSIAPQNIIAQKSNKTTYKISWDPLSRENSNGEVLVYEVQWSTSSAQVGLQNSTDPFAMLHGLIPCSVYRVKVRAYTSAGPGLFGSLPVDIVTTVPSAPTDVNTAVRPGKRTVTLRWNKPLLNGNDVQRYTIIHEGKKSYYPNFRHVGSLETKFLTITVDKLYPGTKYNFVIIAATQCGSSENSSVVSSETLNDAPLAPVFHEPLDLSITESAVNVIVWAALQDNGPISHYQVLVHLVKESTDNVTDWTRLGTDLYIAAQIPSHNLNPFLVFVLGDGKEYGGFVNKELSGRKKYNIYSRALTVKSRKKRSTEDRFLIGDARLIAKVKVDEDEPEQGALLNPDRAQTLNSGFRNKFYVSLVFNGVLGVAFILSVCGNVYLWLRPRRSADAVDSHSGNEAGREATDPENERVTANDHPPQGESSSGMELQPTQTSHLTDHPPQGESSNGMERQPTQTSHLTDQQDKMPPVSSLKGRKGKKANSVAPLNTRSSERPTKKESNSLWG